MNSLLIDTSVLVDHLRGVSGANDFMVKLDEQPSISALTVAELFSGVKGQRERVSLHNLVDACNVIPVTTEIAEDGVLIRNRYLKSHRLGLADALIGATAISTRSTLVTLDKKHFPMLKKVRVPY